MENNLFESLDTKGYDYSIQKEEYNNIAYVFEDERGHSYKVLLHKKGVAGKYVWAAIVSEKTPNAKAYKRVIGKFNDPNKALSTILEIFKEIREERKSRVRGLLFEIPRRVFGNVSDRLERILRLALRGLYDVPKVEYTDEELVKLDMLGIPLVVKPFKYQDIFIIGTQKETPEVDNKKDDVLTKETKKDEPAKAEVKPEPKEKPFKEKLKSHINKFKSNSIDDSKEKVKELDTKELYAKLLKIKPNDFNDKDGISFNNESSKISINFYYRSSSRIIDYSMSYNDDDIFNAFIKTDTFKKIESSLKLKKKYDYSRVVYRNTVSVESFEKLIDSSVEKAIQNFIKYNHEESDVEDVNINNIPLKRYFGYDLKSVKDLIDKDGNINFVAKNFLGKDIKVDVSVDEKSGDLQVKFEGADPDTFYDTVSSKYLAKSTNINGNISTLTTDGRYGGFDTDELLKFIKRLSSNMELVDSYIDDYGFNYNISKIAGNEYFGYIIPPKNVRISKAPYKTSLSFNGRNIILDGSYGYFYDTLQHTIRNLSNISKNNDLLNTFKNKQTTPPKLKDSSDIVKEKQKAAPPKQVISKDEFEKIKVLYGARLIYNNLLREYYNEGSPDSINGKDYKELTENNNALFDSIHNLLEVNGVSNPSSELKKIDNNFTSKNKINIVEEMNKLGAYTKSYDDLYYKYADLSYLFDDYVKRLIGEENKNKLVEQFNKIPHKKNVLTVKNIYEIADKVKNHDTYFGFKLIKKDSDDKVKSLIYADPNIKNIKELDTYIDKMIAYSDSHYGDETYSTRDDGTRHKQSSKISNLITEFVNQSGKNISVKDMEFIMDKISTLPSIDHVGLLTSDPEAFRNKFWHQWAGRGGTVAHHVSYAMCNDILANNIDKPFWGEDLILSDDDVKIQIANPYLKHHFKWMYEQTQEFYKNKLGKKYSGHTITLYRGVGGDTINRYTPAPIESWSATKATAQMFAKNMSAGKFKFILVAEVPIEAIIGSWEHLAVSGDFPREEDLKGKKEFMVLGGALKDIEVKAYMSGSKSDTASEIKMFESFSSYITESEKPMKLHGSLKVVFPGDKNFTNPYVDDTIATGLYYAKNKK